MRILWLHQHYATPAGWGSPRTHAFARRLAAAGHQVDVLCGAAYDDTLQRGRVSITDGVRAFVSRTRYRPQMGFAARIVAFLHFTGYCLFFLLRRARRYDLAIVSSPPLTTALPALAGRLCGLRFVFEVIDVWPDAAIAAGRLRNPLLRALSRWLERQAYVRAAAVVTCSPAMTDRVIGKGVPPAKCATLPNYTEPARLQAAAAQRDATRSELGVAPGQVVVLYLGAMGRSNAIEDVLTAVQTTSGDSRIVWWCAGDGADAARLRQAVAHRGGRFFGRLGGADAARICAAADVGLVTFMHHPFFHENSPNKFFDYAAAGLAVIFNRSTWLAETIGRHGNGLVCGDGQPGAEMAAHLARLADEPETLRRMQQASRRLAAQEFDHGRLTEQYATILSQAARCRNHAAESHAR